MSMNDYQGIKVSFMDAFNNMIHDIANSSVVYNTKSLEGNTPNTI